MITSIEIFVWETRTYPKMILEYYNEHFSTLQNYNLGIRMSTRCHIVQFQGRAIKTTLRGKISPFIAQRHTSVPIIPQGLQ